MAKICPLFSGSDGNSTYISYGRSSLLIDVGVSTRRLTDALEGRGLEPSTLSGIFITHAHTDHVQGLKVFAKKYRIPIFGSEATLELLASKELLPAEARIIPFDGSVTEGTVKISAFNTLHDSPGSRGYTVEFENGERAAVCTDLGVVTDEVRNALIGCRTVVIESNHDTTRLQRGPYPYDLKMRIAGDHGHLSNTACSAELPCLAEKGAVRFILAHLSKENNLPDTARSAAVGSLLTHGLRENEDYLLSVAAPEGNPIVNT